MLTRKVVAFAVLMLTGCASLKEAMYNPGLSVTQSVPAAINLGAARKLSIVQLGQARAAVKEKLVSEMLRQGRAGGVFQVSDRSEEGILINVAGRTAASSAPIGDGEVFVKADVIETGADSVSKQVQQRDSAGNVYNKTVNVYQGRSTIAFFAINKQGKALASDKQIDGAFEGKTKEEAVDGAVRDAIAKFYAAITPRSAARQLKFDKSDLAQRPILDTAAGGAVPKATDEMRVYLGANPSNPVAMFNMAVLLEAGGRYQEALDHYSNAAAAAPTKQEYTAAKTACATVLANQQALAE